MAIVEGHFDAFVKRELNLAHQTFSELTDEPKKLVRASFEWQSDLDEEYDQFKGEDIPLKPMDKVMLSVYFAIQMIRYPINRRVSQKVLPSDPITQVAINPPDVLRYAEEIFQCEWALFASDRVPLAFRERVYTNITLDANNKSASSSMTFLFPLSPRYGMVFFRSDHGDVMRMIRALSAMDGLSIFCNTLNFADEVLYYRHSAGKFTQALKEVYVYQSHAQMIDEYLPLEVCSTSSRGFAELSLGGSKAKQVIKKAEEDCSSCLMAAFHKYACNSIAQSRRGQG